MKITLIALAVIAVTTAHADLITISETQSIAASGGINATPPQSYSLAASSGSLSDAIVSGTTVANSLAQQTAIVSDNSITLNDQVSAHVTPSENGIAFASASSDFSLVFTIDSLSTYSFTVLEDSVLRPVNGSSYSFDFSLVGAQSGEVLESNVSLTNGLVPQSGLLDPDTYTMTYDASAVAGEDPLGAQASVDDQFGLSVTPVSDSTPTWILFGIAVAVIAALRCMISDTLPEQRHPFAGNELAGRRYLAPSLR